MIKPVFSPEEIKLLIADRFSAYGYQGGNQAFYRKILNNGWKFSLHGWLKYPDLTARQMMLYYAPKYDDPDEGVRCHLGKFSDLKSSMDMLSGVRPYSRESTDSNGES